MCSITPRRIAVTGSATSPGASSSSSSAAGGRAGLTAGVAATGAAAGVGGCGAACCGVVTGSGGAGGGGAAAGCGSTTAGGASSAAAGAGAAAPDSMKARMSFFVTRPPCPVPWTAFGSTPCSAAMRATTGDTNVRPSPWRAGAAGATGACGGWLAGTSGGGACAGSGSARGGGDGLGSGLGRGRDGLGFGLGRRDRRLRRRRAVGPGRAGRCDDCEHRADLDRRPLLHEDLGDDTLARARHLGVDLVGRDLEQRLVQRDGLALLLEPLGDGAFGHGDTHLGHHHLDLGSGAHVSSKPRWGRDAARPRPSTPPAP